MTLRLNGTTSGYVELDSASTGGNNTIVLPSSNGSANQFLKNSSTAGTLGWSSLVETATGVGIGTASPGALLDVYKGSGSSYVDSIFLSNSSGAGANQGIAWGSTTNISGRIKGLDDGAYGTHLIFENRTGGPSTTTTERMRIQADGTVKVTNSGTNILFVNTGANNTALCYFQTASAELGKIRINGAGVAYDTTSDYRLKENLEPIADATTRVQALKPWRFNFISHPEVTVDGFLAHEAQEVVPEAVGGHKDEEDADGNPVYQGIDQSKLVPLLTAALQESIARIETLEAANAALETRLAALEAQS